VEAGPGADGWLEDTPASFVGFDVETCRTLTSAESKMGGVILARRHVTGFL
jgi:hypothetical protein